MHLRRSPSAKRQPYVSDTFPFHKIEWNIVVWYGCVTVLMDWKGVMEGFGGRNLSLEACKTPEDVNLARVCNNNGKCRYEQTILFIHGWRDKQR